MLREELRETILEMVEKGREDILSETVKIITFLLDNCEINIPEENRFFVCVNSDLLMSDVKRYRVEKLNFKKSAGEIVGAWQGKCDFGHTSPDWKRILDYGIYGLACLVNKKKNESVDAKAKMFYTACAELYASVLKFMKRAAAQAEKSGKFEMAKGIQALTEREPRTLFEAMQTTVIYYALQQRFEHAILRTLGRLDALYFDFYKKETDSDYVNALLFDFLKEIDSWHTQSNIPFALGADPYRGCATNELTYLFLKTYRKMNLPNTKIHLIVCRDTPDAILREAFSSIREGKNSIIFLSDETVRHALVRSHATPEDALDFHVVGCYECGARGELTCSCNATVNIPKAVEYAMTGGVDLMTNERIGLPREGEILTFEDFFAEYLRQLHYLAQEAFSDTEKYERHYPELFAAPFLSSTYESSMEKGCDVYSAQGAKYNNSSCNFIGLATAIDSLIAIRKLVFEEKILTLDGFVDILRGNWQGHEVLRQRVKHTFPKYGCGDANVDILATRSVESMGKYVGERKNARGGVWRLGLFSINWRWAYGAKTAASADARLAGEPISQNTGASFGADRNGATAHMLSLCALDNTLVPNGSVLDLDLHASAVQGDAGLLALLGGVRTYFDLGGFGVHYNILDAKTLREAKAHPEDYPNLQIRLCGWNVLFSTLSDREKSEFIARFEEKEKRA